MKIDIIYHFYAKFLYIDSAYCIILITYAYNTSVISMKKDPTGKPRIRQSMIQQIFRSADLCFHIVTYHVLYKCMAKSQDTLLYM